MNESGEEWGEGPEIGVRGVVRRELHRAASMPLEKAAAIFRYRGGASAQFLAMADPHADRRR